MRVNGKIAAEDDHMTRDLGRTAPLRRAAALWRSAALAVAAVLFATSQAPYYWPAVDPHLPSLHHLVMSVSDWLLGNTHL